MKIIRPVEVTDSIVTENTAYPPINNEWEARGYAEIPSASSGGVYRTAIDMAFSSAQNSLALVSAPEGSVSGGFNIVQTDGAQIYLSDSAGNRNLVAADPASGGYAILSNHNVISIWGPTGGLVSSTFFPPSSPDYNTVYQSQMFWDGDRIVILQRYTRDGASDEWAMKGIDVTDRSSPTESWEVEFDSSVYDDLRILNLFDDEIPMYKVFSVSGNPAYSRHDPVDGSLINTMNNDLFAGMQSIVRISSNPYLYYFTRSGSGRGLYKFDANMDKPSEDIITIDQPSGLPVEPGELARSPSGSMISVSGGFSNHILDTATDTWIAGTERETFKTGPYTPIIPFSRDGGLIAVGPRQPDDLGLYNMWDTSNWTQITAEQSLYFSGDRVTLNNNVYEAAVDNPALSPEEGILSSPPQWILIGATNPWRMFDRATNTQSSGQSPMIISIQPGVLVNGIALFSVDAGTLRVTMTDPAEGLVYDSGEIDMLDNSFINDWYAYFFEPYTPRPDIALLDLPPYPDAEISITLTSLSGDVKVGEIVFGSIQRLGVAQYGTSVGIIDFSRKEQDQFGNFSILQRRFSKRAEYDIKINTGAASGIQRTLANYRTTPVVWVGDENKDETIVYGYYRDFEILLSGPSLSDCTITVEGL